MKTKFAPILSFLFLCYAQLVEAQEKTILLDTLTFTSPTSLPFDEPFFLGIPVKTQVVTSSAYVQVKKNGHFYDDKIPVDVKPNVKKLGTQLYNFIEVKDPYLLNPGKHYAFIWTEGLSDDIVKAFDDYNVYKVNGNAASFTEAKTIILGIAAANLKKAGTVVIFNPLDSSLSTLDDYYKDPLNKLPANYKIYLKALADYNTHFSATLASKLKGSPQLDLLLNTVVQKNDNFDPELKDKLLKDPRVSVFRLNRLLNMADSDYTKLKKGLTTLDCDTCQPTKDNDYDGRFNNINTTLAGINELYLVAVSLKAVTGMAQVIALLNDVQNDISQAAKDIKILADTRRPILSAITDLGISNFSQVNGSSVVQTFDVRTKLSIAPDFGFVTTRLFDNKKNPYAFVPYLGFHVNFRPLNRDIPFYSYHHRDRAAIYFSAFAGWSLVNISDGPTLSNTKDSISGFFTGSKGTLMTGIGFRLGNFVRLTSGAMYYFKYDQKSTTPISYDRKLKAWPFIGLSLDLALKDLLNGITDVFAAAPKVNNPPVALQ